MSLDAKQRASYLKLSGKEAFLNQLAVKLRKSPRRVFGAALCVVGVVLLVASVAGGMSGAPPDTSQPRATAIGAPEVSPGGEAAEPTQAAGQATPQTTPKQSSQPQANTPQTQSANTQPTPTTESPPKPDPNAFTVSLKINNQPAANVSVPPGSNQCDVLVKAREQGVIQSLNMRWDEDKQTYGVYQINGIGDPKIVSWVYEVNNTSPFKGCSQIAANANDTIHWKHLN